MVLKIRCKSFSVYLGIRVKVAEMKTIERFALGSLADWSNNFFPNSKGREKLRRITK